MEARDVSAVTDGLPWMTAAQGSAIIEFIRRNGIRDVLELGFCHGVSTCYLAAAVGVEGSVTTIDKQSARDRSPNVETLLARAGLGDRVSVFYEARSYNWRLMKLLQASSVPRFDLCFIDGAHSWLEDGFAFFLADRLLRKGGWMLLDDLDWRLANAPDPKSRALAALAGADECETPQVRRVYELLVKTHPDYGEFRTEDTWAFARKLEHRNPSEIRSETIVRTLPVPTEFLRQLMERELEAKSAAKG